MSNSWKKTSANNISEISDNKFNAEATLTPVTDPTQTNFPTSTVFLISQGLVPFQRPPKNPSQLCLKRVVCNNGHTCGWNLQAQDRCLSGYILHDWKVLVFLTKRLIYSTFYKKKGGALNPGRIVGVIISYLGLLGAIGVFGVNFWKNYLNKWFLLERIYFWRKLNFSRCK
jgi:hypothetical protein